jgi:hypothetical protein
VAGFRNPGIVEQHVKAAPALVCRIEHALDVRCPGDVRLDKSLPELVSEGLRAIAIHIRQQQLRAVTCHAPSARSADAARSARDERVNNVEPISHLTIARHSRARLVDCASAFGPVLEGTEIVGLIVAHVFEHLAAQGQAAARGTVGDDRFIFAKFLSW